MVSICHFRSPCYLSKVSKGLWHTVQEIEIEIESNRSRYIFFQTTDLPSKHEIAIVFVSTPSRKKIKDNKKTKQLLN